MLTAEFYHILTSIDGRLSTASRTLTLDAGYLKGLATRRPEDGLALSVDAVTNGICCYFPASTIAIAEVDLVAAPPVAAVIELKGRATTAPLEGMRVGMKLWTEQSPQGVSELRVELSAYGAHEGSKWELAPAFPLYRDSLLAGLRLDAVDDSAHPLFVLSSHNAAGEGAGSGLRCLGPLDLNSIRAATPGLLLGEDSKDKHAIAVGMVHVWPEPAGIRKASHTLASFEFHGALPDATDGRKLAGLFPLSKVLYAVKGSPMYNTATRRWEPSTSVLWVADLQLPVPSSPSIPIAVRIHGTDGTLRLSSNLTEGLSVAWDALAHMLPGTAIQIPDCGFRLQEFVKLTQFEIAAGRKGDRDLRIESLALRVETAESNRWQLIEGLLTLDAIDFEVFLRDPLGSPQLTFTIRGLIGIGKKGCLSLSADFTHGSDASDFVFRGNLLAEAPLDIREVLTHFLGHSSYPAIPALEVEELRFAVRPKSKVYQGEIAIGGKWQLLDRIALESVSFELYHDDSEGDTTFHAMGVFALADVELYVLADYVSGGQGWTFAGGTLENCEIPIGEWISGIRKDFGWSAEIPLPSALRELTLLNLAVRMNTAVQAYSFQASAKFPIDGVARDHAEAAMLTVQLDLEQRRATFRGYLSVLDREFTVAFASNGLLVAAYDGTRAEPVDLKQLLSRISKSLGNLVTPGVQIDLKHAQLAFDKRANDSRFLFGLELGGGIALSNLPVVGFLFGREQTLAVVFHLLATSGAFDTSDISAINQLTGLQATRLPDDFTASAEPAFRIEAAVNFGGVSQKVNLPLSTDVGKKDQPASTTPAIQPVGGPGIFQWIKIEKTLGPFHFQRIGIGTDGQTISFLMDAFFRTAGLTITLEGLGARSKFSDLSLHKFEPEFQLSGLGIDFRKGDLEIGGALIKRPSEKAYDGAVTIRYKQLGIEAFGTYETAGQQPSLFIYALIRYPLGGPAFFYVEGGAVGFGYNRTFTVPGIDEVASFPLVQQALAPPQARLAPMQVAKLLSRHIQPAAGQYFISAGIKFNSYKTIEGFVLLTVLFGDHFEIDVLGKATLTAPAGPRKAGTAPLLSASLTLLGRYVPDQGMMMIRAQLAPDAHLFAPACHLAGGFALYCWFDKQHKGDFVLTMGGYHKEFQVPDHYPSVPRLALNWQVDSNLSIKAEAYFALTPSAIMAGGKLEVNWQSGNLQAWFRAELDFLIGWQPFSYHGHAFVSLGARYRFEFLGKREISAELTAELNVWGPPFSGRAHVQWHIISFDVTFGKEQARPPELDWAAFRNAFLPVAKDQTKPEEGRMYKVTADLGKVAQGSGSVGSAQGTPGDLGVINARNLRITVRSPLPVKQPMESLLLSATDWLPNPPAQPRLGIAPMGKAHEKWKSSLQIRVIRQGPGIHDETDASKEFRAVCIREPVPVSLWDEEIDPTLRKDPRRLIEHAICGYELHPKVPATGAGLRKVTSPSSTIVGLGLIRPYHPYPPSMYQGTGEIRTCSLSETGETLRDLLPVAEVNWSNITLAALRHKPRVVRLGSPPQGGR